MGSSRRHCRNSGPPRGEPSRDSDGLSVASSNSIMSATSSLLVEQIPGTRGTSRIGTRSTQVLRLSPPMIQGPVTWRIDARQGRGDASDGGDWTTRSVRKAAAMKDEWLRSIEEAPQRLSDFCLLGGAARVTVRGRIRRGRAVGGGDPR